MRIRAGRHKSPAAELTRRQEEVVRLMADGLTNAEIGERLGITLDGAKFHVSEVMNRLGANSREDAVAAWRASNGRRWGLGAPLAWAAMGAGVAVVAGVVLVAPSALQGDSESHSTENVGLAEAAARAGESSASMSLRVQLRLADGREIDVPAKGVFDFQNDSFAIELDDGRKQILKDGVFYDWDSELRKWRKYPANSANTGELSGQHWLDLIAGAKDVEFVGVEEISGELAAHHRFATPYPLRPTVPQAVVDQYRLTPRLIDVWVANGRPVKAIQRIEKRNTGDPEQDGEVSVITIEWSDWGRNVDIQAPDPALVED